MAKVEDLLNDAILLAINKETSLYSKWISAQYKLAEFTPAGSLLSFSQLIEIDLLIRAVDSERLTRIAGNNSDKHHVDNFSVSLSERWMSKLYEVLRIARAKSGNTLPSQLNDVFAEAELVRMAIDKGEVAGAHRKSAPEFDVGHEDDTDSWRYSNDSSYIVPRKMCGATGSMMWVCIDLKRQTSVEVCRQDISDRLLSALV